MIFGHKPQLRTIAAVLLAVLTLSAFLGACNNNPSVSPTQGASDINPNDDFYNRGNSAGNIIGGGIAAISGEYMYFRGGRQNSFKLLKRKIGTTEVTKLASDNVMYINVVGEWVYYSNIADKYNLYKVKTDGTGREKISTDKCEFVSVVGGWIYYSNTDDGGAIYKMNVDGTGRVKLNSDDSMYINVMGDYIYFSNRTQGYKLFKMKTDGTGAAALDNETVVSRLVVTGEYIFYTNVSIEAKNSLWRMKTDGTSKTRITEDTVNNFTINNGWIYYINESDTILSSIYKMKLNGGSKTKLTFDQDFWLSVVGDLVFYCIDTDGRNVFTVPVGNDYGPNSTIAKEQPYGREAVD